MCAHVMSVYHHSVASQCISVGTLGSPNRFTFFFVVTVGTGALTDYFSKQIGTQINQMSVRGTINHSAVCQAHVPGVALLFRKSLLNGQWEIVTDEHHP